MAIIIFNTFVVLDISNKFYDATNIKSTETKKKGRRTAESAAVLSRHRFGMSSSDLPPLFNLKSKKVMLDKTDNCTTCANRPLTADLIITDFLREAEMAFFSENLHEMFLAFVRDYDGIAPDFKADVVHAYTCLRDHINKIEKLQKERSKK